MKLNYSVFFAVAISLVSVVFNGCATHYKELPGMPEYPENNKNYDLSAVIEVLPNKQKLLENELRKNLTSYGYVNFSVASYYKDTPAEKIRLITFMDVSRNSIQRPEGWYLDTRIIVSVRRPGTVWNQKLIYLRPRYFQAFSRIMTYEKKPGPTDFKAANELAFKNLFSIDEFRSALEPEKNPRTSVKFAAKTPDTMWKLSLACQNSDPYEALRWAFLAAENGNQAATEYITHCSENNDIFGDNHTLYDFISKAAEKKHPAAMLQLGALYELGIGVQQNIKSAFYWYKKAADMGNVQGMFLTAICLENGIGVNKNIKQALAYYKRAAALKHPEAIKKAADLIK